MRHWITAFALLTPVALGGTALAQQGPSVEQIIKSLTPTGDVTRAGTRGIRPSQPTDARATPSATTPVSRSSGQPAPAAEQTPTLSLTVNFQTGSAELTPQAVSMLDRLGAALASNQLANYRFRIEGHTDTVGSKDYNLGLSDRRAQAVVTYIRDKFGVEPARLEPVGLGSSRPMVATADQVDEPRNRRVQVTNIGG
jgi:outer membrane protein OmpA-like peptidoglycan-associated protein